MFASLMGLLMALSIGLVGAGGFYIGSGYVLTGIAMVTLGTVWNSIVYVRVLCVLS